jgi:hypothetical protein
MANAYNPGTCPCKTQEYAPIVFNTVAYQNSANTVYNAKNLSINAATDGTLGKAATGNPIFKSDYERMQYLLGKQSVASCGVPAKTFTLGTN